MPEKSILIVEDEPRLARLMGDYFLKEGFDVHLIDHGDEVLPWLAENTVDAMLLDVMLPGKDGMTICREVRQTSQLPILMVTARVEEVDRLLGLELGADDYICKPFSPREVVLRVRNLLRRLERPVDDAPSNWVLDQDRYEFRMGDERVPLTAIEFHLLDKLCRDPGRIYSRDQLMTGMYADNRVVSERTIDSHVKKLRRKLEAVAPDLIESVYGVGYRVTDG